MIKKVEKAMNFKRKILTILTAILCLSSFAQTDVFEKEKLQEALDSLDEVIEHKEEYARAWQATTDRIKISALHQKGMDRVSAYWEVMDRYRRVQTDSAQHYLNTLRQLAEVQEDRELAANLQISQADIYGVSGLYMSAIELLEKVEPQGLGNDLQAQYYHTLRTIYGWLGDYASSSNLKEKYVMITAQYRDSILRYDHDSISRHIVLADKYLINGDTDHALALCKKDLTAATSANKRYIYSNMAEAYRQNDDNARYEYYLALTSIDDLRSGVREYMALPKLALSCYEHGDYERAYRYLTCTMEDASACKARLRAVESSRFFPIIDKAYKKQEQSQRRTERLFTYALVGFALLLGGLLLMLRKQNRKLASARHDLLSANEQLKNSNQALEKTDKVKEDYIAYYLDKCRGYLGALQKYRRDLLKLAKGRQHEELLKRLNSSEVMDEEQQRFYKDFDEAFLNIHPQFVERFNALLEEDKQIKVKRGELMTTELRIFALIRLGVSDTAAIAHFLNYSTATVYNYRSRVRNSSKYGKEEFEEKVIGL